MTDTKMLKDKISETGISISFIARTMGISREGLYKKINNDSEFKASEITALVKILRLKKEERDNIFFTSKVNKNHGN